ncbi:MAG TPA: hypothetical protein VGI20_11885 [Rhizomicrobium sp.]|jgi:hypothetical protein
MKCKPQSIGGKGLATLAGLMMAAATPAFAQYQSGPSQGQSMPSQTSPDQSSPSKMGSPSDQSYQSNTGSMQNQGKASSSSTSSSANAESLTRVKNAKTTLASAQVQDSSGQQVGQVSNVHTTRSGHASKVYITLSSSGGGQAKTISVSASKLKYDKSSNTLITNMTANDLQAMPAATSSGL